MTISAKSCNRECPVTEIKELTSFFATSTRRAESTIYVYSSRKRQESPKKDKKVGKVGDGATTFQRIAGPATFKWLGRNRAIDPAEWPGPEGKEQGETAPALA